jgi:hypothetical protein
MPLRRENLSARRCPQSERCTLPAPDYQNQQKNQWRGKAGDEQGPLPFLAQDNLASARLLGGIGSVLFPCGILHDGQQCGALIVVPGGWIA